MQLFVILFLIMIVSTEAKRKRTQKTEAKKQMQRELQFNNGDDQNEDKYFHHVPFGHIFKEGYEDPNHGFKHPIDLLELDTAYVSDGPYAREFIKNNPTKYQMVENSNIVKNLKPPPYFTGGEANSKNPPKIDPDFTDDDVLEQTNVRGVHGIPLDNNKNISSIRTFWNLEGILKRNLDEPPKYRIGGGQKPIYRRMPTELDTGNKSRADFFAESSYDLKTGMEEPLEIHNFTTCDEFGKRAKFHPNDIVNLDWVPFFIWTNTLRGIVGVSRVHRFSFPTKKFVKNLKEDYSSFLDKAVDWEQPKMILKHDMTESLLIAVNRSGLFVSIPYLNLPKHVKSNPESMNIRIPTPAIRLKIVDPYLAMMYCDHQYAVIMAISGSEPNTPKRCISEAATLKMIGRGFPVKRNTYLEALESRAKYLESAQREQQKYITLEDQMAAERT